MSEKSETPKNSNELYREAIIKTAQDPVKMLIQFKDKGLVSSIWSLITARDTIRADSTYHIAGVNLQFKIFYSAKSDTKEFYEALVSMLKEAEYNKSQLDDAFFDMIAERSKSSTEFRTVARGVSKVCQDATAKIFVDT